MAAPLLGGVRGWVYLYAPRNRRITAGEKDVSAKLFPDFVLGWALDAVIH
jgi:hypothetical protein